MPTRVLETVLVGRNMLSPVLAGAGRDVQAYNAAVSGSQAKASAAATQGAAVQSAAGQKIAVSASMG